MSFKLILSFILIILLFGCKPNTAEKQNFVLSETAVTNTLVSSIA